MDVSIVIPNWNTKELTCECISSICRETTAVSYEIIIVDNGSADGSVEVIKSRFPDVRIVVNKINRGFAAACNQGMLAGKGRYVLLLNSDILILDSAIDKTVRYADSQPQAAVVGCQVRNDDYGVSKTCFRFPSVLDLIFRTFGFSKIFKNSRLFGRERMQWWARDTEEEVEVVTGMFMLARRCAIDEVGLMDEDYFFYCEEVDWCYRFRKAGWKVKFWPGASIIHVGGGNQSSRKIPVKAFVQEQKSVLTFFRKQRGLISYVIARIIFVILYVLRYCFWTLLLFIKPTRLKKESYRMERQKALAALKFCALSVEPGRPQTQIMSVMRRKAVAIIEFVSALINLAVLTVLRRGPRKVVLYYHDVEKRQLSQFEKQMEYLAGNCRVVKPSEIKSVSSNGDKVIVAVTFDDACAGIFENAVPVLRKLGLTAGVSVPTKYLDGRPVWLGSDLPFNEDNPVMNEEQVRELDRAGFEIFSHTVTHGRLTELVDNRLSMELTESKRVLEKIIGRDVIGICYPEGDNDKRVCQYSRWAGYRYGFTIEPSLVDGSADDMQLGRFGVFPDESLRTFRLKANGSYSVIKYLRAMKRFLIRKGR
jgi:GT2 family glycosyltransferase/peptidoglycan/xylan/chitin deacetylase (PgdA/CDA1 family)